MLLNFSSAVPCVMVLLCVFYPSEGQIDPETLPKPKSSCKCVPYYLCNTTNSTTIDEKDNRDNGTSCANFLEVCCEDNNVSMESTKSSLDLLVDSIFNTNDTGSGQNSSACTCVPYYLCNPTKTELSGNESGIIDIRLEGDLPCESYLEVCCKPEFLIDEPVNQPTPTKKRCGYRNKDGVGFRISDSGFEAQFGEFPWMIAVLRTEKVNGNELKIYQCGGALISPEVVLTAAHCVAGFKITADNRLIIRAGEWDTQTVKELYPHQDREVSSIVVHPQYNKGRLYNDIALLFLITPVTIEENVNVVCLPSQSEVFDSSKCFVSGWGRNIFGKKGRYQVILKKIDLPMMTRALCQENLRRKTKVGRYFELHQSFVCAGGESGKDACKGDGGSPLVCPISGHEKEERYAHVGIVAWGSGCGEADVPGVYANVASFRDWIDDQLKLKNINLLSYQFV